VTVRSLFSRAQRLLAVVVLVVSGAYLLVYLYRWEWNRAIISGIFFVAAEVALVGSMLLRRIQRLEQRTGGSAADAGGVTPDVGARLRATPVDRPDPFAWLKETTTGVGVFVPVLLGAGAILSAVAYVVERVAEATALPVFDRRIAARLSALGLPPDGAAAEGPSPGMRLSTALRVLVASLALLLVGWLAFEALLDATQSRPEVAERPAATVLELQISRRGDGASTVRTAEALWVGCRPSLGSLPVAGRVVAVGPGRVELVLEPGIGDLSTRRLTGCLDDLRIDRALARTLRVEHRS
jgi:hypothetical protein